MTSKMFLPTLKSRSIMLDLVVMRTSNCWYKMFNSSMSKNWELPLLIVCLVLTMPVSNAFVERLFSLMKRVKTTVRSSMDNLMLNCVIRICQEGPPFDKFKATSTLKQFMETKDHRLHQILRKSYKKASCKG